MILFFVYAAIVIIMSIDNAIKHHRKDQEIERLHGLLASAEMERDGYRQMSDYYAGQLHQKVTGTK